MYLTRCLFVSSFVPRLWRRHLAAHRCIGARRYRFSRFATAAMTMTTATTTTNTPTKPSKRTRSPYELVHFRRSRFVAHLNELRRRNALPVGAELDAPASLERALTDAGDAHEARVIARILAAVAQLDDSPVASIPLHAPDRYEQTRTAIESGVPAIIQAALTDGFFGGYADLLVRDSCNPYLTAVSRDTANPLAYSVFEVKLSSIARIDFALQTAVYTDLLERAGARCEHAFLCLGGSDEAIRPLDVTVLSFLRERTLREFRHFLDNFNVLTPIPDVDGPIHAMRPWSEFAQQQLDNFDSLLTIAGIRRKQARFIQDRLGLYTLTGFSRCPPHAIHWAVKGTGVASESLFKLQDQAKLQNETVKRDGHIAYRVLDSTNVAYGLNQIAPREPTDVYFDIEGYPLFEQSGGLEYLLGVTEEDSGEFRSWWAHSREEEERSFIALIDYLYAKVDGRIYHYGNYEIAALRRVSARATTVQGREAGRRLEVMISARRFVDVYKCVRNGLRVGERSYSIKTVEKLVGVSREEDDLADAQSSVGMYHEWRIGRDEQMSEPKEIDELVLRTHQLSMQVDINNNNGSQKLLNDIQEYNKRDCESLRSVVAWLREQAQAKGITYTGLPEFRNDEDDDDVQDKGDELYLKEACGRGELEKEADALAIRRCDELTAEFLSGGSGSSSGGENVKPTKEMQIMAHLLQFYSREKAPARFRFMDRVTKAYCNDVDAMWEDHECISTSKLIGAEMLDSGAFVYEFGYDNEQPLSMKKGSSVAIVIGGASNRPDDKAPQMIADFGTVSEMTELSVVVRAKEEVPLRSDDFVVLVRSDELVLCPAPMRANLLASAEEISETGQCRNVLVSNFIARRQPFGGNEIDVLELENALQSLKYHTVVIQGPPGSGKTTFSAALICSLLKAGKSVAVSSNSHAAIDNLLARCVSRGVDPNIVAKVGARSESLRNIRAAPNIGRMPKNTQLVGATVYGLARAEPERFDLLFVDEASQVSMANYAVMARCARAGVLVGDQQQLEMPVQGAHPDMVKKSCLAHMAGEGAVIDSKRGVFLDTSFRLQPAICEFVSKHFYDGALRSHDGCHKNSLDLDKAEIGLVSKGKGIVFVPVEDEPHSPGGSKVSPTECTVVRNVVDELLGLRCTVRGKQRVISEKDILVVSAFNAQVQALKGALSVEGANGVRVGTVDRFQGQEAPVVIVSICTAVVDIDAVDENNRGLEFSITANRLNVAISRASCLAIIVGDPKATSEAHVESLESARSFALYDALAEYGAS